MGQSDIDYNLVVGMTLYDVDTKSIGILIRRFSTREASMADYDGSYTIPYELVWELNEYITWAWDSIWSKDGRVIYSETGLINLIKAGIITIIDDGSDRP